MIFIEQSKEQVQAAFAFHAHASINEISLIAAQVKRLESSDDVAFPLESMVRFRHEKHAVQDRKVKIITAFGFHVTTPESGEKSGPKKPVFVIDAKFETVYELRGNYEPSADEIEAFKSGNAIFNTWPFFREYVYSTVNRMGYPAPSIPFLRLVPKKDNIKSEVGPTQIEGAKEEGKSKQPAKRSRLLARATDHRKVR